MKKLLSSIAILFALLSSHTAIAQSTGIGTTTPDASAVLDITATSKGLLIPRVSLTGAYDATTIPNAAQFMVVFNTNYNMVNNLSGQGIYINYGAGGMPNWVRVGSGNWSLLGNAGTYPGYNFIGTTDAQPLVFKINNQNAGIIDSVQQNTALGYRSLDANASGFSNAAYGYKTLKNNTTGFYNTATGVSGLFSNTSGIDNSADGALALYYNTTGSNNVANGAGSMYSNTSGNTNAAVGVSSLYSNLTGSDNVAIGINSLFSNTAGNANTASGEAALYSNTTGNGNVATGDRALFNNTVGYSNVAIGKSALYNNLGGNNTIAIGDSALFHHNSPYTNKSIAIGSKALFSEMGSSLENTALGSYSLYHTTTGDFNTAVGIDAGYNNTTGSYNAAYGIAALYSNTTGSENISIGHWSLYNNTTGNNNIGIGTSALSDNTYGEENIAIGEIALSTNTTGIQNVAIGGSRNLNGNGNTGCGFASLGSGGLAGANQSNYQTAFGYQALTGFLSTGNPGNTAIGNNSMEYVLNSINNTAVGDQTLNGSANNNVGNGNTAIGYQAAKSMPSTSTDCTFLGKYASSTLTTLFTNSTALGANSKITGSNQVVLGDANILEVIPGRNGYTQVGPNLGNAARGWDKIYAYNGTIQTSDFRLKKNIANTPYGLKEILALRPVIYNWKKEGDGNTRMSGFIAQEVEKLVPEAVVAPKNADEYYGMKYEAIIPVLTKAIQEQQALIEQLQARLSALEKSNKAAIVSETK